MAKADFEMIAQAIRETLVSPNVCDSNFEHANVVDVINYVSIAGYRIANAITPADASPGPGANGGQVGSLTEAVMDLSESMAKIAMAIEGLSLSVDHTNE